MLENCFKNEKDNIDLTKSNKDINNENLFSQILEIIGSHELMPAILSAYTRDHHLRKQAGSAAFRELMGEEDYNDVEAFPAVLSENSFFESEEGKRAICPMLHLVAFVSKVRLVLFYLDQQSNTVHSRQFPEEEEKKESREHTVYLLEEHGTIYLLSESLASSCLSKIVNPPPTHPVTMTDTFATYLPSSPEKSSNKEA